MSSIKFRISRTRRDRFDRVFEDNAIWSIHFFFICIPKSRRRGRKCDRLWRNLPIELADTVLRDTKSRTLLRRRKKKDEKKKRREKKTGEKVVQPFETRFHPKAAISTTLSEEKPTALFKQGSRKSDSLGVSKKKKKKKSHPSWPGRLNSLSFADGGRKKRDTADVCSRSEFRN